MKITKTIILMFFLSIKALAQVGIGTPAPDASAILEVKSENKGVTFPHVTLAGIEDKTTVPNPVNGTTVFNTSTTNGMTTGIYFWNTYLGTGGQWERLLDSDTNVNISYSKEQDTSIVKGNYLVIVNSGYPRESIKASTGLTPNATYNITIPSNTATDITYSNKAPGGNYMNVWKTFPRDASATYMDLGTGTFTAPATDNYQITCGAFGLFQFSGGSGNVNLYMAIDGDNSRVAQGPVTSFYSDVEYTYTGPLNAGQKVKCYIVQNSGRNFTTQSTYFSASYVR